MPKKPKPLRTVAVCSLKGGAGKSTITVHLAVEAVRYLKEDVLILDTDPQRSCVLWASLRDQEYPHVETADLSAVPARIESAASKGYRYVFVDFSPRTSSAVASALKAVDFLLVPLPPNAFDVGTLEQTLSIATAAGKPGAIILSRCPPRAREVIELRESLAGLALPLAALQITERRVYARSLAAGQSVSEVEPDSSASAEISALWKFIRKATI